MKTLKLNKYEDVENIIFDFGGVLLDIDYQKTTNALESLLHEPAEFSQANQSELFDAIETGHISPDQFRERLRAACKDAQISDEKLDRAWNAMLGPIPKKKIELLKNLRAHYRKIYLLSNTNAIHIAAVEPAMAEAAGSVSAFEALFDEIYYSHHLRMRKPHVETFTKVIKDQNIEPKRTLFIDDSIQHIEGARRAGLQTHHLTGDLFDLFTG